MINYELLIEVAAGADIWKGSFLRALFLCPVWDVSPRRDDSRIGSAIKYVS